MGWLSRIFKRAETINPIHPRDPALVGLLGGATSASGISVDEESALKYSAVFCAMRILSEGVATLPLFLYLRTDDGRREAVNHPLFELLHGAPNSEMTSFTFIQLMMYHVLSWGNAYAEIQRTNRGDVGALWPLNPESVRAERTRGTRKLVYDVMRRGESNVVLDPESMWHLAGLGFDGITGYSPIRMAANSLGLAIQAENFGAAFFGRGAVPSVVIRHPLHMGPEGRDSFRAQFAQLYGHSAGGPHGVAVLDEGMSLDQITIPPEDAQFLETRKFQVTEVARWYRIPPHMLGDLERATLNNIEHQGIEFVVYSLLPWLRRIETQIWLKLLNQNDKRQFYAEFKVQGLARGDQKSRYESYAIGRQWGWLSANDIRRLENMEPIEGGDMYLRPLNMIAADTVMEGM